MLTNHPIILTIPFKSAMLRLLKPPLMQIILYNSELLFYFENSICTAENFADLSRRTVAALLRPPFRLGLASFIFHSSDNHFLCS